MRNFGSNAEHRDALEDYIKVAAEHGHARSGANMMIERFVAIGETEEQAERNLDSLARAFGQFLSLYIGRRPAGRPGDRRRVPRRQRRRRPQEPPGHRRLRHPGQIIGALQQVIDETGARRLLVETFSRDEARLFAREVIPALKQRNTATA